MAEPARAFRTLPPGRVADAALFLLLLGVLVWRVGPQLAALLGIESAIAAPDVRLTSIDGDEIQLGALRERVVVVTFWASWCRQCEPTMRALREIEAKYGPEDIVVLALSTGNERESAIRRYLAEHRFELWVGRASPTVRSGFGGVPGIPTTFLIDRSGRIRHRLYGPLSELTLGVLVGRLVDRSADS